MPRIHSHLPRDGSAFGSSGQYAVYAKALALYRQDRLENAFSAMLELGAGSTGEAIPTYRMIEAELMTRRRATVFEPSPVLRLEVIESAVDPRIVGDLLMMARQETSERLGLAWDSVVHATILDEAANAPWAPGRHGYCSPKEGFAKVCLPHYLVRDRQDLLAAFRHELVHALAFQEADDACEEWLHEAAAMQIGGESTDRARRHFKARPQDWRPAEELSAAFQAPRLSETEQARATVAYWQSALIGEYLLKVHGERVFGRLLTAHRLSLVDQIRSAFLGVSATQIAVKHVLMLSIGDLFDAAEKSFVASAPR